jgi:Flp pilus assembly protein TadB
LSDSDGPSAGFWWKVIGGVFVFGIGAFVVMWLVARAAYAWGVLGAFVFVILVLMGVAWLFDRRNVARRRGDFDT